MVFEPLARLVAAQCPNCGAGLTVPPGAEWVTCGYCRVSSFVQRARSPAQAPAPAAVPVGTPVIHVPESGGFAWLWIGLVVVVSAAVAFVAFELNNRLANVALLMQPLLFDVNRDGADDVLIVGANTGNPARHLRALDAYTGTTLWKTDDLGTDVEHVALAGDAVLWLSSSKLRGFDATTGRERFARDLPERVTGVCEAGATFQLHTADDLVHAIDPGTGALTTIGKPAAPAGGSDAPSCTPAWSTFATFGRLVRPDDSAKVHVEGMTTSTALRFGSDALPALLLGSRAQGSAVPMLAGVRDGQTLWTVELPSTAPLEVHPGDPEGATIAAARAYASYERTSARGFTVVAVSLTNGERYWETAVPRESYASVTLRASDRHVFARGDFSLYALAATDGRLLWRVGWDPGAD
jgi:hypothetical protein